MITVVVENRCDRCQTTVVKIAMRWNESLRAAKVRAEKAALLCEWTQEGTLFICPVCVKEASHA